MKVTLIASVLAVAQAAVVADDENCVAGDSCASKSFSCCTFEAGDGSGSVTQCRPSDSANIVMDDVEYSKGTCPTPPAPVAAAESASVLAPAAISMAAAAYCLA